MSAFNVVRFRVRPDQEQAFLNAQKNVGHEWPGLKHANIVQIGEQSDRIIAEWDSTEALAKARPNMIATLNSFRDTLEDLGGGLGVQIRYRGRS